MKKELEEQIKELVENPNLPFGKSVFIDQVKLKPNKKTKYLSKKFVTQYYLRERFYKPILVKSNYLNINND